MLCFLVDGSFRRPLVWCGSLERHSSYCEGEERPGLHSAMQVPAGTGADGGSSVVIAETRTRNRWGVSSALPLSYQCTADIADAWDSAGNSHCRH